ncbi:MAG: hypothetical protein Q7R39_14295 [Dehalococcoidia bacterium]|nr:hypothetical protein [Dehalococcoidia bacterium]
MAQALTALHQPSPSDSPALSPQPPGGWHTLAVKNDGTVWSWGKNDRGQLGNGQTGGVSLSPGHVASLSGVVTGIAEGGGNDKMVDALRLRAQDLCYVGGIRNPA